MTDTYENLKTAIADWSHRDDLTTFIDTYIDFAESQAATQLRIRAMEARATAALSTTTRFLALPADYIQMRKMEIELSAGNQDIKFMAPEQLPHTSTSGIPKFFTVTSQIELDRVSESAYTVRMQYFKKITPLDGTNTTNWLTDNAPQLLLYGALSYLFEHMQDDQQAQKYSDLFLGAIATQNDSDKKGRYGPAPYARIEGNSP